MTKTRCCWCGGPFKRIEGIFWCTSEPCRARQAAEGIYARNIETGLGKFLYLPLPRQVDYDNVSSRYLLGGGAAGASKSHSARWGMYKRALKYPQYEALILRKTWPELEKHHFRLMDRDAEVFRAHGIDAHFSITHREFRFGNGSVIEGGHMENKEDVQKYLSRERDEIVCDEGSTFDPKALLELSTRARTTKPHILADGIRGLFRLFTNPGGPSASMIRDFFLDHEPNWEEFPEALRTAYNPDDWVYVPGNLEDNPYLSPDYESDLALLEPWRYEQLRNNDWDIIAGLFFTNFKGTVHVKDLGDPGNSVEWFRSMDYGYVSPGCFLWWACLPDVRFYIRHEYKFQGQLIPDICQTVLDLEESWGIPGVRYTVADPAIWSPAGNSGEDINETFNMNKVYVIKGKNERVNGWQRVREMLRLREDGSPTLIIHPDCRYLIRCITGAISDPKNPEDVDTSIDDHAIDALRYGAMSRPAPTRTRTTKKAGTFNAAMALVAKQQQQMRTRA